MCVGVCGNAYRWDGDILGWGACVCLVCVGCVCMCVGVVVDGGCAYGHCQASSLLCIRMW